MEETKSIEVNSITLFDTPYFDVTVTRSAYYSDPDTLALVATWDGEPLAAFSVNLPGNPPAPGCVWLKTWSEGVGVTAQLVKLGIVETTGRSAEAGYSRAIEARIIGKLAVDA